VSTPSTSDFNSEASLKMITHQARHHGNQMSVLALSSEIFL